MPLVVNLTFNEQLKNVNIKILPLFDDGSLIELKHN
jgi:hypothetical protein